MLASAYGAVLILIGLDKALGTDLIVEWTKYVSPLAQNVIPLDPNVFVRVLGVAEILVGALFFTRWVVVASTVAIVVLVLIIVDLLNLRMYDIAARDALIALGAYAVIRLARAEGFTLQGRS
jgi:hypothetical protein